MFGNWTGCIVTESNRTINSVTKCEVVVIGIFMEITANDKRLWLSPIGALWVYLSINRNVWYSINGHADHIKNLSSQLIYFARKIRNPYFLEFLRVTGLSEMLIKEERGIEILRSADDLLAKHFASNNLHLVVPLDGEVKALQRQFAELLKSERIGRNAGQGVGVDELRNVGPIQLNSFVGLDYEVIGKAAEVWLQHEMATIEKSLGGRLGRSKLYEIGEDLGASPTNNPAEGDTPEQTKAKRNSMKVIVSRMIDRADAVLLNVEQCVFPSYKPPEAVEGVVTDEPLPFDPEKEKKRLEHLWFVKAEVERWNRLVGKVA